MTDAVMAASLPNPKRRPSRSTRPEWERRDDMAVLLFRRMLDRRPVWVNSPMGQRVWIQSVGLDGDTGECVAFDHNGNDRFCDEYLLDNPHRQESGA